LARGGEHQPRVADDVFDVEGAGVRDRGVDDVVAGAREALTDVASSLSANTTSVRNARLRGLREPKSSVANSLVLFQHETSVVRIVTEPFLELIGERCEQCRLALFLVSALT